MEDEDREKSGFLTEVHGGLTRREMLRTFCAGAVAVSFGNPLAKECVASATRTDSKSEALVELKPGAPRIVEEFGLAKVRLLDGPFLRAQQRDARYLLQIEPDRLLHNFRSNAGLKPKAPVYGGWESEEPWIAIRCHGHTLGHYLSACSLMFAATANHTFKERTDYIVAELRECQDAAKSGLVCAFPDASAPLDAILTSTHFVGVPWYTMHKILAGLRDANIYTGNPTALEVLVRLSDWAIGHTENLSDQQFQHMLGTEHGGMNEVLADLYSLTGEPRFRTLAERFCHGALLDPLAQSRDTLDGLHSNTQIPKVIGFNRLYEVTGQANYSRAARFFWSTVVENRTFATGGNGDGEHFFPPADFVRHLGSAKTMETCCTYNMLKLTRNLFALDPSVIYADYYERALYNSILASQDPDSGMMTYFQPTRPGYLKFYCTPTDSFWCCTGSGMENHAKYGDSIYFHRNDTLFLNLFIPSTLDWKEKGVTITQTTQFPDEDKTRLQLKLEKPTRLTFNIRHPFWCKTVTIFVNGHRHTTSGEAGRYIPVNRLWRSGDTVEVRLPMTLHTEPLPGQMDVVAVLYGPIVLAGPLGTKGVEPGADIIINERTIGDSLNDKVEVPVLVGEPSEIVRHITRVTGAPLTFQTKSIGRPNDINLIPYYRIAHERYNLYWKVVNKDETEKKPLGTY